VRVATRVHAHYDADQLGCRDEVDGIGEPAQQRAAAGLVDDGALRRACNLGQDDIDGAQELEAEAGRALLLPACGLNDVCLGGRVDDEASGHSA
jgi:hypothetical protein